MTARTTESTITFENAFKLSHMDGSQPAGTYRLVTVDEEMPSLSVVASRQAYTMLHVTAGGGKTQVFTVDPQELEAALTADQGLAADEPATGEAV